MAKLHHNWPRFWIPLGSTAPLDGTGFLYVPEGKDVIFYYDTNNQPHPLSQLVNLPVTILLGEPGIGKSTTLQDESKRLHAEEEACFYRELNQYHSDTRLIDDIFGSEEIQKWRQSEYHLTLLLDSLDECSLSIPAVARILLRQLKDLPKERLSLRLTCRTADWPTHFTEELRTLWPRKEKNEPDPLGVFELAPLRKKDIRQAALDHSLNADAFLKEICLKEIQPLASHPNTLNMLLGLFGRPDGLPRQRAKLYCLGCESLAEEASPFRQESRHTGEFTARQRMAVAGRIAAQMVFSHRSTIWYGSGSEAETTDLIEGDITGNTEQADGQDFSIDSHVLQETIECALFSGRGEKRIGFAHQSYMEFLAAWHLNTHRLESRHILALLRHPDDGRIPPQHTETAIWLAALDENIFTALVETESLLLLRTDLSDATDEQKAQLAEKLLSSFAAQTEFDRDWRLRQHYRKLAHPHLARQLRPYITDKDTTFVARQAAMEIASACNTQELENDLVSIALNQEEEQQHRLNTISAVVNLADGRQLAALRSIALGKAGDDPEDRLKTSVIPSLWPKHISTEEIFGLLSQTQNVCCLDGFDHLREEFLQKFSNNDLIIALQWIASIGDTQLDYDADRIKDSIMVETGSRVDDPRVLGALSNTVWACLDRYEPIFNRCGKREKNWLEQDHSKRRMLIIGLLETCADSTDEPRLRRLIVNKCQVILSEDSFWLLECYQASGSASALRAKLAKCIAFSVHWEAPMAWLEAVITAACADAPNAESPLADAVAFLLEPIALDSETARMLKEHHTQQIEWRLQPIDPPPPVRVEQALQKFESGNNDAWIDLWNELSLKDKATRYQWSSDRIIKLPGWQRATSQDRTRIVCCAEAWVTKKCFAPKNTVRLHTASYLALYLLAEENPQFLERSSENWCRWAKTIIYSSDNQPEPRETLLKQAYSNAPDGVLDIFRHLIDQDISTSQPLHKKRELSVIWDRRVAELLNDFLAKPNLTPVQISGFLDALLEHDDETAFKFACNIVTTLSPPPVGPLNYPLILAAAQSLATNQLQKTWPIIWKKMSGDSGFGKSLMLGLAYHSARDSSLIISLSETHIMELYFWLEAHFPAAKDSHYPSGKTHTVAARDEVRRLRDSCINYLSGLGTQLAIDALHLISDRFPEKDWLKYLLNEAQRAFRKATLQALSPAELIDYTHRRDARLARSSTELMDAVLHSLHNLQVKLQGQTPLAPFLWNICDNGKSRRPKSEDRMTDFIKHHLETDLPTFVIDREVQIRNLNEHGIGERTDLKIETKDSEGRSLCVIIESKGCWNTGLLTAMKNQLSEQYLALVPKACGIYLVGWFRCERWNGKGDCAYKKTKEKLLNELNAQARILSNDKKNISVFVLDATY